MKAPTIAGTHLPVWQSALLTHGCEVNSGGLLIPLKLHPVGDGIVCTPTVSGCMLPFQVCVTVGQPVTITWDHELSRYIVWTAGQRLAA